MTINTSQRSILIMVLTASMGDGGRLQHLIHGRLLVGDQTHPSHVEVGERPGVLEAAPAAALPTGAA